MVVVACQKNTQCSMGVIYRLTFAPLTGNNDNCICLKNSRNGRKTASEQTKTKLYTRLDLLLNGNLNLCK